MLSPANNLTNTASGFNLASDNANPALGSFGTIGLGMSRSLVLNGFEMYTWNDGGHSENNAMLFYRVTKPGDTPGSFSSTAAGSPTSIDGNDKLRQKTDSGVNLTTGLSNGDWMIDFHVENSASFTGGGGGTFTMGNWNSSSGPSATFSIIPEPAGAALGLIGNLLLLRRSRF